MHWLFIIAFLIQQTITSHVLYILGPPELSSKFKAGAISLHSSSLGYTPKGVNINGVISISDPEDACSQLTHLESSGTLHSFVLTNSHNCATSTKVNNIFKANGYAAIVIKDSDTQIQKHGSKVNMPVLSINPSDAEILINFKKNNPNSEIISSIHFNNPSHKPSKGEVDVTLWMSSTSIEAYNFIQKFKDFYFSQGNKIFFEPRFVLDTRGTNKSTYHVGCLSSGKYCAPQLQLHSRTQGKQVVQEDLRQIIIYQLSPNLWWNYALNWKIDCLSNPNIFSQSKAAELCSNYSMVKTGLNPEQIKILFIQSFRGPKIQIQDNQYLMGELSLQQTMNVQKWPRIYINNAPYETGKQSISQNVVEIQLRICDTQYPNWNSQCEQLNSTYRPVEGDDFWIIPLVIVLLLLLMFVLVAIYNFIMKRRMKTQVQQEVQRVLEQYYTYEGATRLENM